MRMGIVPLALLALVFVGCANTFVRVTNATPAKIWVYLVSDPLLGKARYLSQSSADIEPGQTRELAVRADEGESPRLTARVSELDRRDDWPRSDMVCEQDVPSSGSVAVVLGCLAFHLPPSSGNYLK